MRFQLIDRIDHWEAGKSLLAAKFLALGEEYLADHFPKFPVMPGVLMLEALVEGAAWLWRASTDYRHPVIVLREARNVKYGNFMQPGHWMTVAVELVKTDGVTAVFRGKGINDAGDQTVSAQFTLFGYSLSDRGPAGVAADEKLQKHWRERWALLTGELSRPKVIATT
ncbi:3-hydroxyacyl-[acyl-carrier-protein] dehydratase FabZ [Limnoglobus roseus]|uniref:3-hydroxyacyl-[acyl-carrier-protein] dehydratase FabZ n=1 Tax=Limnoglobus roseus TaxID=2598579 RepID=A0A5C1AB84_9BACT|nr:3-hydroxyacyl-[acyl-carrier-protein] dehydratase FabZ [Limnoglobus roseus]